MNSIMLFLILFTECSWKTLYRLNLSFPEILSLFREAFLGKSSRKYKRLIFGKLIKPHIWSFNRIAASDMYLDRPLFLGSKVLVEGVNFRGLDCHLNKFCDRFLNSLVNVIVEIKKIFSTVAAIDISPKKGFWVENNRPTKNMSNPVFPKMLLSFPEIISGKAFSGKVQNPFDNDFFTVVKWSIVIQYFLSTSLVNVFRLPAALKPQIPSGCFIQGCFYRSAIKFFWVWVWSNVKYFRALERTMCILTGQ